MPTDDQPRRPASAWLLPAATFVAGAVLALVLAAPPTDPASAPSAAPPAPAAPQNSDAAAELALMRQINTGFVTQLRAYEERLRTIADAAQAEGAPQAAEDMRDFALETSDIIRRYDLILRN